jgi:hypothetical protein
VIVVVLIDKGNSSVFAFHVQTSPPEAAILDFRHDLDFSLVQIVKKLKQKQSFFF